MESRRLAAFVGLTLWLLVSPVWAAVDCTDVITPVDAGNAASFDCGAAGCLPDFVGEAGGATVTIEFWWNGNNVNRAGYRCPVNAQNGATWHEQICVEDDGTGECGDDTCSGVSANGGGGSTYVNHADNFSDSGVWNHFAYVYDAGAFAAGADIQLYLNGATLGAAAEDIIEFNPAADVLNLCVLDEFSSDIADGELYGLRIWTVARTAAQLGDHDLCEVVDGTTGLWGQWELAETGTPTTFASTGTGNDCGSNCDITANDQAAAANPTNTWADDDTGADCVTLGGGARRRVAPMVISDRGSQ